MGRQAIHTSVEDCLRLDTASEAVRSQLVPGGVRTGSWTWSRDGERVAQIGYYMNGLRDERLTLELDYSASGMQVRQFVNVVQTRPHYGGSRWWFLCPKAFEDGQERRVRCLYMPPGQTRFASRIAYSLNYDSQKTSSLSRTISRFLRGSL
jgi:hypothetical protein